MSGIIILKSLEETTREDFDRMMSVNCYSHLAGIQAVVPAMRRAGGGSVVNVASVGALVALPNVSMYCPPNRRCSDLTRATAAEFVPRHPGQRRVSGRDGDGNVAYPPGEFRG